MIIKTMNFTCIKMDEGVLLRSGEKGKYIKRNVRKAVPLKCELYRGIGTSIEYCL